MRGLGFAILCDVFMFFGLVEMVGVFYYGSRLPIVLFCRVALLGFAILCNMFMFFGLVEMVDVIYYDSGLPIIPFAG